MTRQASGSSARGFGFGNTGETWAIWSAQRSFDTGAVKNAVILSVPEGHDKPLSKPADVRGGGCAARQQDRRAAYFDFDMDKLTEFAHMRKPGLQIFPSAPRPLRAWTPVGLAPGTVRDWQTQT
jgi:hydrogenase nickel incorporation protein HypB